MPACSSEGFATGTRYRSSSPPNSRSNSASPPLSWPVAPGSPPLSVSPSHPPPGGAFKRSISNLSSSSLTNTSQIVFTDYQNQTSGGSSRTSDSSVSPMTYFYRRSVLEREGHEERTTNLATRSILRTKHRQDESETSAFKKLFFPARIIAWYINLVISFYRRLTYTLSYLMWAPVIWMSAWICVFWVMMQLPLNLMKWFIRVLYTPSSERLRNKRCVLITGGSTIQALHLARNFYKAGARVVVCEIDGLFGLVRFSTACSRFYNVPRPGPGTAAEYVDALRRIVLREKVVYFIPVSCTSGAYYDALAKPHLEILGCECFVPEAADVTSLEDPLQLIQRCAGLGLPSPVHRVIRNPEDLAGLYETGHFASNDRHVLISAGPAGMHERAKLHLPNSVDNAAPRNLRRKLDSYEISERKPWILLREPAACSNGYQLVTCTTVKDSRVVANVTCRLDERWGLVPEERSDVSQWLEDFFRGPFAKRINGHLSFKLAVNPETSQGLVPMSCRVGVPLPYLCLTSVHPRLVWRPCRHFSRQNSVNLVVNEKYKKTMWATHRSATTEGLFAPARSSTVLPGENANTRINERTNDANYFPIPSSPALDKMDALFVYWDPLPYCAYYHLQFPFRRLAGAIREGPAQHKPPLAVVQ